ncbi:hypothetical protein RBH29_13555 [Herbivorax sp. ANBcel31]|uniref:hypothetical protein n=1 Tax=Herbivorax sp. ANBcel31 TaxID=3069754 RepID=UPI0027B0ABB5|nr:hypothetical protein [Herbivorax sp. ANBcel31]MDQ2087452.1 hypothetical protein [Herbivorax sp. ANBcel31]
MINQEEIRYFANGFIIKRIDSQYAGYYKNYFGIEGDIWPIDKYAKNISKKEIEYFDKYLDENIYKADNNEKFVDVCNDIDFLNTYINACKIEEYKVEVLFCETQRLFPKCEINPHKYSEIFEFLGHDYGYPGVDYYSGVYNDVKRLSQTSQFLLNSNGLFEDQDKLLEYIELREKLKKELPENMLEQGEFIIYKLWRYIGDYPIKI